MVDALAYDVLVERIPTLAAELLHRGRDVIVIADTQEVAAAMDVSQTRTFRVTPRRGPLLGMLM